MLCVSQFTKKLHKIMIKNFLLNNTNFNENDVNCIIEKLNKKSMQVYIEMLKNNYCEKINQIDVTLYCNHFEIENNIYVQFTINYLNCNTNKNMIEIKCFLIDCECDVCDVNDELIFSHLIKILMNTNNCNFIDIENINFNLIN